MSGLGRAAARVFIAFVVAYAALFLLASVIYREPPARYVDTGAARSTVYGSEPKYLLFSRAPAAQPGPAITVIGASMAVRGFRPEEMNRLLPGWHFHNMAIGWQMAHTLRDSADAWLEARRAAPGGQGPRDRDIVVIGLWYGFFLHERIEGGAEKSPYRAEMRRYGLYTAKGRRLERRVPFEAVEMTGLLLRPVIMLGRVWTEASDSWPQVFGALRRGDRRALSMALATFDTETFSLLPEERERSLAIWRDAEDAAQGLQFSQFERLETTVRSLREAGQRVLLLDLPVPAWHGEKMRSFMQYQLAKGPIFGKLLADPGVRYLDLSRDNDDDNFYDSVHVRPTHARRWMRALVAAVRDWTAVEP
jgi:hypothetical protein